ncbi:MAG: DUF4293 domain-containing protein [Flavobacteriaceae bacterium]|nr:DUF4293 domain-containing protein [Flavobacteriaceae bacterium]
MIQRIQSVFLFLAAIVSGVFSHIFDLWRDGQEWMQANDYVLIYALFIGSGIISLANIFFFKNRKRQMLFNIINIFLNFVLVGLLVYRLFNLPGDGFSSEKGVGLFLPLISILLLWLANSSIIKDEKLVKSIDRIR